MSKKQSLTEQLEELQNAADQLTEYQKLFDKACQINFGMSAKAIKKMTESGAENYSEFEKKICNYFGLKTATDKKDFLSIMCSESSKKFFNSKRENDDVVAPAEQG
jgi:hypothetical protein